METGIPARLSAAAGRTFGATVGGAFVVIGALLWWRGKHVAATIALGVGCTLILAGLVIPTYLGPVERAWMGLAHLMSKITTPIFMGIVYFLVLTPIGLVRRRNGSPLTAPVRETAWREHTPAVADPKQMERQF